MCMAAIGILGGVISGLGAMQQANAAAASHKANADMERRQAAIERTAGSFKAQRQQDQVDRVAGQQRAAIGGSGISLTSGSAEDIVSETAEEGALDVAAIRWNSGLAGDNYTYKSKISDMNAKSAKSSAPLAFITPVIGSVARYQSSFG